MHKVKNGFVGIVWRDRDRESVNYLWLWLGLMCRDELSLELGLIIPNTNKQTIKQANQQKEKRNTEISLRDIDRKKVRKKDL